MYNKISHSVASIARNLAFLIVLFGTFTHTAYAFEGGGPIITICDDYLPAGSVDSHGQSLIRIAPNPFTTYFQITSTAENEIQHIEVLDANATLILSEDLSGNCFIIDTEDWEAGEYIVNVTSASNNISQRVIKTE